jgi:hypothetical protein
MFVSIGFLTNFNVGQDSSHCFILLAVFLDPILPALVAGLLRLFPSRSVMLGLVITTSERMICWSVFIGGCLIGGKVLYSIYLGITLLFY